MNTDYQQRYQLELAQKTLRWGTPIAVVAIIFITIFYFGDIHELALKNTLSWRLLGILGPVLYLGARFVGVLQQRVILLYSTMMLLIIMMMSVLAVIIFMDPGATDHQVFAVTTGYMSVWGVTALIAFGGRRPISLVGGGILILTIVTCLWFENTGDGTGFIFSMLLAGVFSIGIMLIQARYDRERAFSVYELEDSRDKIKQQAEDLQLANDNLMTFTRAMSHDLQSPLRSVRSFLDLFEKRSEGNIPENAREYLGLARHYLQKGQDVVSDLLTYAKIGKDPIAKLSISLKELVGQVVDELTSLPADMDKFQFEYELREPMITADQKLVWHVFQNLISNAIKFSQNTADPKVVIRSFLNDKEVIIEVRDNGVGFDQDFSKELGKPFTRLHGSEFSGTGIGLSIVRQVMELHGGRFWAESKSGEGASFFCAFPVTKEA